MSTMRLPAKLSPPQARNAWPRTRLFEELDGALGAHGILWIAASPGAGKSALVASYLNARRRPAVWYHIDEGDRDPATFLRNRPNQTVIDPRAQCLISWERGRTSSSTRAA